MKAVFLLFDSLNRRSLGAYGGTSVPTPNFDRLTRRAVTFDTHYVGSLPCMPARRDMHTGRLSFLHRTWGPLEPFDNSFPEILGRNGVYSHFVTDHYHYWEDGGATYHNRYNTYEFIRGQERDPWKAKIDAPWARLRDKYHRAQFDDKPRSLFHNHIVNREYIREEKDFPSVQCVDAGLAFLDENRTAEDWLLQIETFDPHEPFHAPDKYREGFPTDYDGPIRDWPPYERVTEGPNESEELRANYNAMIAFCDAQLGRVLDYFDQHDMWSDTALILTTDHGYLLGEHGWWAKHRMPVYEEIARVPLFIYHPTHADQGGTRRKSLTQTIDLMPTILEMFGQTPPPEVEGHSLLPMLSKDEPVRQAALFGTFGAATNITDGRYTYFRYPDPMRESDLFEYTLMPTRIASLFDPTDLADVTLSEPFSFTKGTRLLKIPGTEKQPLLRGMGQDCYQDTGTVLFDLQTDPGQVAPLVDAPEVVAVLSDQMTSLMRANDAPPEAFARLGL
ncbi:sulfatase [Oceaniglobus trochenteri]|uniref:sulfatase n=1 Tax=Oceaniglobus trochenteri TaxID=2763260 RepID=UPI001CFF94B1|nr:sulfatase [Oceaniglobus trochenteri]